MLTPTEIRKNFLARKGIKPKPPKPLPDPVDWIEANFYIPETNAPIKLVPYQKAVIKEGLRTEKGLFVYSFILWSDIKKSAKSTIAGAISLYLAWHHAWETVRVVANDLKQADSRTFFYIERAIRMNPAWKDLCKISNYHITLPNHTSINAIPVDPKGEAGGGDLVTTFTEMWAMKSKAAQALWSETTLSPLKFGKSIRVGEGYAGYIGDSPVLEPLYEIGVKQGGHLDLSYDDPLLGWQDLSDLEVYRNGRTLALWNTKPRCPWQTEDYYAQEHSYLTDSEFDRMHGNKWSASQETFIPDQWWDACLQPMNDLGRRGVVLGVDAASKDDCFALVIVSKEGQDMAAVRYVKVFTPPKGGQIDFEEVEAEILRLYDQFYIVEVAYDERDLVSMSQRLGKRVKWRVFSQATPRLVADKRLYDMIRDRRILHSGEPDLKQHIQNSDRKPEDEQLRIVKRHTSDKIDACVALSMAVDRVMKLNL
jgi:Phage terminase-like protein, large subunit